MKKALLIVAILFFSVNSFGQASNLTIFSEDGTPFYLVLNGIRQNQNPETNIRVNGLINEYYNAKIIFNNQSIPLIEKNYLMVVDANKTRGEATYKITRNRKGDLKFRFFSFTPTYQMLPPPSHVSIIEFNTTPMPEIIYSETTTTTTTTVGGTGNENVGVQINVGGIGMDANININDSMNSGSTTTTTTTTTTTSGYPVNVDSEILVEEVGCYPMDNGMFSNALYSIENKDFSDTQLTLAKQIVSSNCLLSSQIKEIARIFDFEDTKLSFAKFSYRYCYDPENYWQINDVFDFESTVEELNEFISHR